MRTAVRDFQIGTLAGIAPSVACEMQHRGFDLPKGKGDVPLGVNMGSHSIPYNSFGCPVFAYMHSIARTPDIHVLDG